MVFETLFLVGGDLDYGAVFGACEIGGFHHPFIEASEWFEVDEIGCLHKAEIVRVDAEDVVHYHPFVLANAFPCVWCLATAFLRVDLPREYVMVRIDFVRHSHSDTAGIFLSHKCGEKSSVRHRAYISVEHLDIGIGISEKRFRLGDECGEVGIGV